MKSLTALVLSILLPMSMLAADATQGYKVVYDGGSLPDEKVGTSMRLVIAEDHIAFLKDKGEVLRVPATAITEIS